MSMARIRCTDRVVGAILASWRYDISGISPEMRRDYESHFAECAHCSARQKFHRSLDATLAILTSLSALFFLFALAVLKHIRPLEHVAFKILGLDIYDMYHMLVSAGIAGLCFSLIAMALVLMATPAPSYLGGIAAERAKLIEERLPAAIKSLRSAVTHFPALQLSGPPHAGGPSCVCSSVRLILLSPPADLRPSSAWARRASE